MSRIRAFGSFALAASALVLTACAGPGKQPPPAAAQGPDIVPVPEIVGFSHGTPLTIRNQGTTPMANAGRCIG